MSDAEDNTGVMAEDADATMEDTGAADTRPGKKLRKKWPDVRPRMRESLFQETT